MEEVDLIARDRKEMNSPCEEVLLNKLLNEMHGLKEDADILFILNLDVRAGWQCNQGRPFISVAH